MCGGARGKGALQGQSWHPGGQKGRENGSRCYQANGEVISALEIEPERKSQTERL